LSAWVNLSPRHKEQLPLILKQVKDFLWHKFSKESRIEIFSLGNELAEDRLKKGLHLLLPEEIKRSQF
jgi:hypothetical protein